MIEFINFIEKVKNNFQTGRLKVRENIELPGGISCDLAGEKTYFSFKGLVVLSRYFLIQKKDNVTVEDLKHLFDSGFTWAKRVNRVPLFRGLQFAYLVIPVIVSETTPSQETLNYIESGARKHFSLFEFPVIIDLQAGKAHYLRKTQLWGAFYYSDMRKAVSKFIESTLG
ncbi:MAG: hypothetical protein OEZ34_04560 [Spirochaetia bacterium]|nr:hypothetical protein [Spirochaetia bacterium]